MRGLTATCQEGTYELSLKNRESAQGKPSLSGEPQKLLFSSCPTQQALQSHYLTQHGSAEPFSLSGLIILGSFIAHRENQEILDVVQVPSKWLSTFLVTIPKETLVLPL